VLIPGLPEGLAFTTMFAALPGALIAAPFSVIVLAVLTTQIGTLQTAPVAIAVLTAYLAVSGTGTLRALANRTRKPAGPGEKPARSSARGRPTKRQPGGVACGAAHGVDSTKSDDARRCAAGEHLLLMSAQFVIATIAVHWFTDAAFGDCASGNHG
jgi:hypothetical protein